MHKKKLVFFVMFMLLLSGCTKIDNDLDEVVNATMNNKSNYVNTVSTGYEIYIPTGVKQVIDSEYNQKIKIRDRYVYLYVDTISYYYKNTLNYKSKDNYNFYFKKLDLNGKNGYIGIDKVQDDLFFCEIVYNYSKTEFYSDMNDLPFILANVLIMQKSIKYNDNLISMGLGNDMNEGREITYQLDGPKDSESTFSDYLQEYVPETEEQVVLPDED